MLIEKIRPSLIFSNDRLAELQAVVPEAFPDGRVDWDVLREAVGGIVDDPESVEHFGLSWPGKREARRLAAKPSHGTLTLASGDGIDEDKTGNLYVEGDNLEVLKLLQKSYASRVKMIFIDPPYNTGADFVYKDDYSEPLDSYLRRSSQASEIGEVLTSNPKSSGRFHTNWLNMMYPRLRLARALLRDDGVIFVSIDDNEVHNLRAIMNEIFGEENFVAQIIWQHSVQPKGYLGKFSVHHNFVLCYSSTESFMLQSLERTEENNVNYSNPDNDPNGPWRTGDVRNALYRRNLIFDIITPSGKVIKPPPNGWRWSSATHSEGV
jgi:adenine-specific DNA-methyltransferase